MVTKAWRYDSIKYMHTVVELSRNNDTSPILHYTDLVACIECIRGLKFNLFSTILTVIYL